MDKYIVAEVTKNWTTQTSDTSELLSQKFEKVINTNLERGYQLVDWKLCAVMSSDELFTETIIAIFEKIGS